MSTFSKYHDKTACGTRRRSAHLCNHENLLFLDSCKICIINDAQTPTFMQAIPPARSAVKKSNASIERSAKVDDTVQKPVRCTRLADKSTHSSGQHQSSDTTFPAPVAFRYHFQRTYHQLRSSVQFSCSIRPGLVSVRRSSAPPGSRGSGGDGSACAS